MAQPKVHVVRFAPKGQIRVLMTILTADQAPTASFGWLYTVHLRSRIEEAVKRLKAACSSNPCLV